MSNLADIIAQETQDGRLIVRFLLSAMHGELPDFQPCHRIDAARLLVKLGFDQAQTVIDRARDAQRAAAQREPRAQPQTRRQCDSHAQPETGWLFESSYQSEPESQSAANSIRDHLAQIVREETDDGRAAVRFLIDAMQGEFPDFKPCHRLSAARELLQRGFDYQPATVIASAAWQSRSSNDAPEPAEPTPEALDARRRAELIEFSKHGPGYYQIHPFPCVCEDRLHDCDGNPLHDEQLDAAARRSPSMEHFIDDPDQMNRFLARYAEYLTTWNAEHPRNPIDINRIIWTHIPWRHLNNVTIRGP